MIESGANPHVLDYGGDSDFNVHSLVARARKRSRISLSNVPTVESIFFPIKSFPRGNLSLPFHYETGIYPGQFYKVIGKGGEEIVIQGVWGSEEAAFKFVQVRDQKFMRNVKDNLADMNTRVREMIEMESISGSNILKFYGHFR